jgi:hypothetical protein
MAHFAWRTETRTECSCFASAMRSADMSARAATLKTACWAAVLEWKTIRMLGELRMGVAMAVGEELAD